MQCIRLHTIISIFQGYVAMVTLLCSRDYVDLNAADQEHIPPILVAIEHNFVQVVELLLAAGNDDVMYAFFFYGACRL